MTAESLSPIHDESEVIKLHAVETNKELAARAVPKVIEWGPSHHRSDYETPDTSSPEGLTYSA